MNGSLRVDIIYHIVTLSSWEEQLGSSDYVHTSLDQEGFIHASNADQIDGVLERYYVGVDDLLKLTIDVDLLNSGSPLKQELAASIGEMFPHIYGPINKSAIINVERIR